MYFADGSTTPEYQPPKMPDIDVKLKDREELGHYDNGMVSHSGPMRGYPSRADAFVWRPY